MSIGLVIASLERGGGFAMLGILVLIAVAAGLVYLERGRRRHDDSLDATPDRRSAA